MSQYDDKPDDMPVEEWNWMTGKLSKKSIEVEQSFHLEQERPVQEDKTLW